MLKSMKIPKEILECREANRVLRCRDCPLFVGCPVLKDFFEGKRRKPR